MEVKRVIDQREPGRQRDIRVRWDLGLGRQKSWWKHRFWEIEAGQRRQHDSVKIHLFGQLWTDNRCQGVFLTKISPEVDADWICLHGYGQSSGLMYVWSCYHWLHNSVNLHNKRAEVGIKTFLKIKKKIYISSQLTIPFGAVVQFCTHSSIPSLQQSCWGRHVGSGMVPLWPRHVPVRGWLQCSRAPLGKAIGHLSEGRRNQGQSMTAP